MRAILPRLPRPAVKGRIRSSPLTAGLNRQALAVGVAHAAADVNAETDCGLRVAAPPATPTVQS